MDYYTQLEQKIIRELKAKGYTNKPIDYGEFQEIYEPYKEDISEVQFAEIIDMKYGSYNDIKYNREHNAIILKEEKGKITEERKAEIVRELKAKGYTNKPINYGEFQEIYVLYAEEMRKANLGEVDFAKIIGMRPTNYDNIKSKEGQRAIILKEEIEKMTEERKAEIVRELKAKGYTNKPIDYSEFQEIYAPYAEEMRKANLREKDFAVIIGSTYTSYDSMKYKKVRTTILKEEIEEITEERKAEIRRELKTKGYTNKLIDYSEFQEIYAPYAEEIRKAKLRERDFAVIIGSTYDSYKYVKYRKGKITILKEEEKKEKITEERKAEIVRELKAKGYTNKSIDYGGFQEIYALYAEEMRKAKLRERDFAVIIGSTYDSYENMKYKKWKIIILKEEKGKMTEERKAEIVRELKAKGYTNKPIDYSEFQEIYKLYAEEMSEANLGERDFAEVIGITYDSYTDISKKGQRAIILKEEIEKMTEERKAEIVRELKAKGYTNKPIDYSEFQEIYAPYAQEMRKADLLESDFAEILGSTYTSYKNIKYKKGQKTTILKEEEKEKITEERKAEIVRELKAKGYTNKPIDYSEFQEIYKLYAEEMSEVEFAKIIGIKYNTLKKDEQRATINFDTDKIDKIKHLLRESKYYTSEELEQICLKLNIDLDELINLATIRRSDVVTENYKRIIRERGKLYIGRTKIGQEFMDKYAYELLSYSNYKSKILGKRYRLNRLGEDIASETLTEIIETRGDIVNNYEEDEAIDILKVALYVGIKYRYLNNLRVKIVYSIDEEKDERKYVARKWLRDKKRDTEKEAIKNSETSRTIDNTQAIDNIQDMDELYETCVSMLNECYQNNMTAKQSINFISKKIGIKKKQLLEIMQKYLIESKKTKLTANGEYIRGEKMPEEDVSEAR